MKFLPSPYKVSTITATGSIHQEIELGLFYELIDVVPPDAEKGIVYIEYGEKKQHTYFKGFHKKQTIARRKKKENKRFDNQATIIIKLYNKELDSYQLVNMKVFRNGNIQMTGLKQISQGVVAIDYLISTLWTFYENGSGDLLPNCNGNKLSVHDYRICLINSDFRVGFEIKRDKLCKIMQTQYNVFCNYEPCIYPGVKIQFNFNDNYDEQEGRCKCASPCNGKGSGSGEGECKKITIAVFQSGCVIITGAQNKEQIENSYEFICAVVKQHALVLYKPSCAELIQQQQSLPS